MNYCLMFCGYRNEIYDIVVRLMNQSARESDYLVTLTAQPMAAPYSPQVLSAKLIGSSRPDILNVAVDFDNVYSGPETPIHLNPKKLDIEIKDNSLHYWGIAGALLKVIPDLSPAYVTSYLLEKDMNDEMALFKKHSVTSLPLEMQDYLTSFIR